MQRLNGFFTPVGIAVFEMALLQFAKVFDADAQAASLTNLLSAAQTDLALVPNVTAAQLDKAQTDLSDSGGTVKALKKWRNKRIAHADAGPAPSERLMNKDFDALVERVKSAFDLLHKGSQGSAIAWDHLPNQTDDHTLRVVENLVRSGDW
jgi:hypothetical protein